MGKLITCDISRLECLVDFLQKICSKTMYFNSNSMLVFFIACGRLTLMY